MNKVIYYACLNNISLVYFYIENLKYFSFSQCLCIQFFLLESWGSHVTTNTLNTEIVVHGSHKETDISTSGDTIIDSDVEIKPVITIF